MQAGVFLFFAGGSGILNSNWHVWQWKEEAMLHLCNFKPHFRQDFLAYSTRPVSVHLAMVCVGCSFDSFSIFLLGLKQQQNLMKILFSCIHFPTWPYPPQIMKKTVFYTSKLCLEGLTGMQCTSNQDSKFSRWSRGAWPLKTSSTSPLVCQTSHFFL